MLVVTLAASTCGQLPITVSGALRLANLTNPDAGPFAPGQGAPLGFLEAYGGLGDPLPSSYPALPAGYNDIGGFTGRLTHHGTTQTHIGQNVVFYLLADSGFIPDPNDPSVLERTISGSWFLYDGSHLSPQGILSGPFSLTIRTVPGPSQSNGEVSGTLTVASSTGSLSGAGTLGALHDLVPEANTFPNWLSTESGQPPTGGDIMFLKVLPRERVTPPATSVLAPGTTDGAAADFNDDGSTDLVFVQQNGSSLAVLANDGTGIMSPSGSLGVGPQPVRVRTADLDGDGRGDLVVAVAGTPAVEVRGGLAGGGYGPPQVLALPGAPGDLALGDLDGDGRPEIACTVPGNGFLPGLVRIFENDGMGGFPTWSDVTGGVFRPTAVSLDLNTAPGRPDLFVSDAGGLVAAPPPGVRAYEVMPGGAMLVGSTPTGAEPRTLVVGDLDHDLQRDLVLARLGTPQTGAGGGLDVLPGTGPGTFSAPVTVLAGRPVTDVAVTDQDRDGRPEVLAALLDQPEMVVQAGWSAGGFTDSFTVPLPGPAFHVLAVDLAPDGFPDLVAASATGGEVSVSLSIPRARAEAYGTGCAGSFGNVPRIAAGRLPDLANPTFSIQLRNALPGAVARLFLSLGPAEFGLPGMPAGCGIFIYPAEPLLIPGTGMGPFLQVTDAAGFAEVLLAIPPLDDLEGIVVYGQWVVIDPGGSVPTSPPVALSGGLLTTIY